jgi:GAF domain-containing protein
MLQRRTVTVDRPACPRRRVKPCALGTVTAGVWMDNQELQRLAMGTEDGEPFTLADAEALTAFAVQAAVAIENVQLHAEAERLSVTDPLTGGCA